MGKILKIVIMALLALMLMTSTATALTAYTHDQDTDTVSVIELADVQGAEVPATAAPSPLVADVVPYLQGPEVPGVGDFRGAVRALSAATCHALGVPHQTREGVTPRLWPCEAPAQDCNHYNHEIGLIMSAGVGFVFVDVDKKQGRPQLE